MIIVIVAGGVGTRLWPLSTSGYPKHLLAVAGGTASLLQQTYERAKQVATTVYVLSEAGHIGHVKKQLPELPDDGFIVEPARRGTASCIVAALAELSGLHEGSEPVAFIPADHYIRDTRGFVHTFKQVEKLVSARPQLALVGLEPDAPATGFGYIEKGELVDENLFAFTVANFKEKPDHDTAVDYVTSGNYLWNSGYFVATLDTVVALMHSHSPYLSEAYDKLCQAGDDYEATYLALENNAIEYALIEHIPDLLVLQASFDWMDLGSFSDLHKAVQSDEEGNFVDGSAHLSDVRNSYVRNHEDKPVAVIGLDNIAVINTPDGVLVVRKDLAQQVGQVSKRIGGE